jgi:glycosyltransferase involved in cell wall biosynthesis
MKALVQQVGARMDYAVPRALYDAGQLASLVTDLYFASPPPSKALARYSAGIPTSHVSRDNRLGLYYRWLLSRGSNRAWPHMCVSEKMADRTVDIACETGAELAYGFDTAMLPVMDRLRDRGLVLVMEQCIAPRAQYIAAMQVVHDKLVRAGLDPVRLGLTDSLSYAAALAGIEREEWARADRVYCASSFVADALVGEGVPRERIQVVPYGVSLPAGVDRHPVRGRSGRRKVAFAGAFSWRKGALEFARLASALKHRATFEAYGTVGLPGDVAAAIAPDVNLRGHLVRNDLLDALMEADIFVLPSYSEGSATVVFEAMALGLPCVVSDATGSVITHGRDGIIVPAGDEAALLEAVAGLLDDDSLREAMGAQAAETARKYTRESYGARVLRALQDDFAAVSRERQR